MQQGSVSSYFVKAYTYVQNKSQADLVMLKELKKKGGNSSSDANEEVDYNKEHIGCTGNLEPEGCWVHYGSDGPPRKKST